MAKTKTIKYSQNIIYKGSVQKTGKKAYIPDQYGTIYIVQGEGWSLSSFLGSYISSYTPSSTSDWGEDEYGRQRSSDFTPHGYACEISGFFLGNKISQGEICIKWYSQRKARYHTMSYSGEFEYNMCDGLLTITCFSDLKQSVEIARLTVGNESISGNLIKDLVWDLPRAKVHSATITFADKWPTVDCVIYEYFRLWNDNFSKDAESYGALVKKHRHCLLDVYSGEQVKTDIENLPLEDGDFVYRDTLNHKIYAKPFPVEEYGHFATLPYYVYSKDGQWVYAVLKDENPDIVKDFFYVKLLNGKWIVHIGKGNFFPENGHLTIISEGVGHGYFEIYQNITLEDILDSVKVNKTIDFSKNGYFRGQLIRKEGLPSSKNSAKREFDISEWSSFGYGTYEYRHWEEIEKEFPDRRDYLSGRFEALGLKYLVQRKQILCNSKTEILDDATYYFGEFSDGKKLYCGLPDDVVDSLILKSKNYFNDVEQKRIAKEKARTTYYREHGYPEDWGKYAKKYGDEIVKKYYESWIDGTQYVIGMPEGLWLQTHWAYKLSSTYSDRYGDWRVYYWNYSGRGYILWFKDGVLKEIHSRDYLLDLT